MLLLPGPGRRDGTDATGYTRREETARQGGSQGNKEHPGRGTETQGAQGTPRGDHGPVRQARDLRRHQERHSEPGHSVPGVHGCQQERQGGANLSLRPRRRGSWRPARTGRLLQVLPRPSKDKGRKGRISGEPRLLQG